MEATLDKIDELNERWNSLECTTNPHSDIWDYEFREAIKDLAWLLIREHLKEKNYYAAAFYLLHGVISSHYWRAREAIENHRKSKSLLRKIRGKKYYPHYELDIDHYTCHWLGANHDRRELFPEEVVKVIAEQFYYEPEKNKYLPMGMTNYQGFDL